MKYPIRMKKELSSSSSSHPGESTQRHTFPRHRSIEHGDTWKKV